MSLTWSPSCCGSIIDACLLVVQYEYRDQHLSSIFCWFCCNTHLPWSLPTEGAMHSTWNPRKFSTNVRLLWLSADSRQTTPIRKIGPADIKHSFRNQLHILLCFFVFEAFSYMGLILHRRGDWMPLIPCQQPHLSSLMILFWCIFLCLYLHLMLMESCFSFLIESPWEAAATISSTHPKLNSPQHSLYWHFSFSFLQISPGNFPPPAETYLSYREIYLSLFPKSYTLLSWQLISDFFFSVSMHGGKRTEKAETSL